VRQNIAWSEASLKTSGLRSETVCGARQSKKNYYTDDSTTNNPNCAANSHKCHPSAQSMFRVAGHNYHRGAPLSAVARATSIVQPQLDHNEQDNNDYGTPSIAVGGADMCTDHPSGVYVVHPDVGGIRCEPTLRHVSSIGVQGAIDVPADEAHLCRNTDTSNNVLVLEYEQDDDEVLLNEEIVEVEVTMDSGSIRNVMNPEDLPSGCDVQRHAQTKNFVGANGGKIINHGTTETHMQQEGSAQVKCRWDCADVTRPLLSTGVTCDSGYEVLHTSDEAVVVPKGTLSKYLSNINIVQKYERHGKGLYTTRMKMKAAARPASGFTRQNSAK